MTTISITTKHSNNIQIYTNSNTTNKNYRSHICQIPMQQEQMKLFSWTFNKYISDYFL